MTVETRPFRQSSPKKLTPGRNGRSLVAKKKMSVALVDISDPAYPKYAALNGEHTMYAASMPKIAILLAVFQKIHDGELEDTPRAARRFDGHD